MKKLNERHIAVISLAMVVIAMCAVGVGDALLAALSGTAYLTVGIATVTIATACVIVLCVAIRHLKKYGEDTLR